MSALRGGKAVAGAAAAYCESWKRSPESVCGRELGRDAKVGEMGAEGLCRMRVWWWRVGGGRCMEEAEGRGCVRVCEGRKVPPSVAQKTVTQRNERKVDRSNSTTDAVPHLLLYVLVRGKGSGFVEAKQLAPVEVVQPNRLIDRDETLWQLSPPAAPSADTRCHSDWTPPTLKPTPHA